MPRAARPPRPHPARRSYAATDIAKGFRSDSFSFTVRSDSVAAAITALSGKRVTVTYQQHVGVPTSCFGETEYFVTAVEPSPE
jgi:hypothetical protein